MVRAKANPKTPENQPIRRIEAPPGVQRMRCEIPDLGRERALHNLLMRRTLDPIEDTPHVENTNVTTPPTNTTAHDENAPARKATRTEALYNFRSEVAHKLFE